MTHGSLFTGIGGFDIAADWMGWDNVFHCEYNPYCNRILKQNFPNSKTYGDITTADFSIHRHSIDVLSGGFPCQPYSIIGEQKGDSDQRHLWPHYLRAIREIAPPWVVPENVSGLVSWDDGRIFEQICADLENEGYEVCPCIIPASGEGEGHQRERVWFIAYSAARRLQRRDNGGKSQYRETANRSVQALVEDRDWTAYAKSFVHRGVYGLSDRVDRTQALGNAIYPHVALNIFKAIQKYEEQAK